MKVTKAVFPVAGLGSRFLPATKATPKEMLPIVDKPLVQYAVEEAVKAGIEEIVFITNSNKSAIENHFDTHYELEHRLAEQGKVESLKMIQGLLPPSVSCIYLRQSEPLGLGHAVLCAKPVIGDHPFAVILADDLIDCEQLGCLAQMKSVFEQQQASVIAVESIKQQDTKKYGVVSLSDDVREIESQQAQLINGIVEKPEPAKAPSRLGVVGRYILTPQIFNYLEKIQAGQGNEIQLTDAIAALLNEQQVYAYQFAGKRYDCGNKLGYLEATLNYGLRHPETKLAFAELIKSINHNL